MPLGAGCHLNHPPTYPHYLLKIGYAIRQLTHKYPPPERYLLIEGGGGEVERRGKGNRALSN